MLALILFHQLPGAGFFLIIYPYCNQACRRQLPHPALQQVSLHPRGNTHLLEQIGHHMSFQPVPGLIDTAQGSGSLLLVHIRLFHHFQQRITLGAGICRRILHRSHLYTQGVLIA